METKFSQLRESFSNLPAKQQKIIYILGTFAIAFIVLWSWEQFHVPQVIEKLEVITYDIRMRLNLGEYEPYPPSKDIVIVKFDDETLFRFRKEIGRWPWPRDRQAEINTFITNHGARVVINDIIFSNFDTDPPEFNTLIRKTFANNKKMYIGDNLDNYFDAYYKLGVSYSLEEQKYILPFTVPVNNQLLSQSQVLNEVFFSLITFNNFEMIDRGLYQPKDRILFLNISQDPDGIFRKTPLLFRFWLRLNPEQHNSLVSQYHGHWFNKDVAYFYIPQIALQMLADLKGIPLQEQPVTLTENYHLQFQGYNIPLTQDGGLLVRWHHPLPGTNAPYPTISLSRIMELMQKEKDEVAWNAQDKALLKLLDNKIIFIGMTSMHLHDIKGTPINGNTPGVYIQANTFDNMWQNIGYMHRVTYGIQVLINGLLCLLTLIAVFRIQRVALSLALTSSVALVYMAAAVYAFKFHFLWLELVLPLTFIVLTFAVGYVFKYFKRNQDYLRTYKLATTDGLTGLHNHRYFQEFMSKNISQCDRFNEEFTLLLLDIDFFKKFNDTYGHQAGDQVLIQVGKTLETNVRQYDLVARYGGEEMAVVLPRTGEEHGFKAAQKLCKAIAEKPYLIAKDTSKHVTVSIGLATYPIHGKTVQELIEYSDQGLYRAKENGRNQVGYQLGQHLEEAPSPLQDPTQN